MKYLTAALLCYCSILFFSSCKKDNNNPAHSPYGFLPKQIVLTDTTWPVGLRVKLYYNIKYATDHQRIDFSYIDSTNAIQREVVFESYIFNSGGYLTGHVLLGPPGEETIHTINRGADNKIKYISNFYKYAGATELNDTCFFSYQPVAGGTVINTLEKKIMYVNGLPQSTRYDTVKYTYDGANRLQKVVISAATSIGSGAYGYTYNANGSILKIHFDGLTGKKIDADFSYNSGLANNKEDDMAKLFLGKDFYLQDIRAFPVIGEREFEPSCFVISQTNIYHISNMHVVEQDNGNGAITDYYFAYRLNNDLSPAAVGSFNRSLMEFVY